MADSELVPKTREQRIYGGEYSANVAIADRLDPDEKVYLLIELNRIDVTSRHVRRWEFIYVQRDGELAVHITDMGPSSLITASELQVISAFEDSVEQCREHANDMRSRDSLKTFFANRAGEMENMKDVWFKWKMELWEQAHNRSHFGPVYHRQRNEANRRNN